MLPNLAAAAAHYKQCAFIPYCHFAPNRHFLKGDKYIALHVTTSMMNFPQNFDYPNRIKHSHSGGLASAFFIKKIID
jgi:hypothetical protein